MAEETTTASSSTTPTPETPAPEAVSPSPPSSTTPSDSLPEETSTHNDGGTLLTGAPAAEPETPPEDKPEATPEEQARAALFGAPEGDYEVAGLPEGVEVDKDAVAALSPVAKELGLSNEGFSKIAQVYASQVLPKVTEQVTGAIEQNIAATHAQWATEATDLVKTDPAFGGKALGEVQQLSAKALDRFGGPEFRTFLNETGLGNHPAMLKFAYLAGSAISEDTSFERGNPTPRPKTSVEKFYPGAGS